MATLNPAAVQNEDIHVLRGKGVEGAKPGIMQNENIHIHKGKGIEGFKAEKPNPLKRHERKALVDLSHAGKPLGSTTTSSKGTALKEKSFANKSIELTEKSKHLKHHEPKALGDLSHARKPLGATAISNRGTALKEKSSANKSIALTEKSTTRERSTAKQALRNNILTDEEVVKCREWAKDGIEYMHYSTNDMHKLEIQQHEERVKKKVSKAMSAVHVGNNISFGLNIPPDVPSDDEGHCKLKFEQEILSSARRAKLPPKPDTINLFDSDDFNDDSLMSQQYELKLKDEHEDDSGIGLKEKSTIKEKSSTQRVPPISNILTDEEIAQCREWAKEGIEHMPFSGNDMRKVEEQQFEDRVNRKVDMAMSALRVWNDATFGLNFPQDVPSDGEEAIHLEFEPEILPSTWRADIPPRLDYEDVDELFGLDDAEYDSLFSNPQYELKLKDEYEDDVDYVKLD